MRFVVFKQSANEHEVFAISAGTSYGEACVLCSARGFPVFNRRPERHIFVMGTSLL